MKLNWNFLGGGGGRKTNNLPWGKVWIFSGTAQFKIYHLVEICKIMPCPQSCVHQPRGGLNLHPEEPVIEHINIYSVRRTV